jgi:hypothetical protein
MIFDRHRIHRFVLPVLLVAMVGVLVVMSAAGGDAAEGKDGRIPFPKPGSHQGNWSEYHGKSVAAGGGSATRPPASCLVCHDRQDCVSCHSLTMPRDHTNYWRTRGHGLMAEGNRERCMICHRQDYCIRCHNETAPRSHVGNWIQRHCTWCHYSGSFAPAENCVVCHKSARHTSAPHPVSPSLNCASCHT